MPIPCLLRHPGQILASPDVTLTSWTGCPPIPRTRLAPAWAPHHSLALGGVPLGPPAPWDKKTPCMLCELQF